MQELLTEVGMRCSLPGSSRILLYTRCDVEGVFQGCVKGCRQPASQVTHSNDALMLTELEL